MPGSLASHPVILLPIRVSQLIVGAILFLLSAFAKQVGKMGTFVLFRSIPYLAVRLIVSVDEARILRDDLMTAMDGVAEELIDQHFPQGHTREHLSRDLIEGLREGKYTDQDKYHAGEFGLSTILTFSALALLYFQMSSELSNAFSISIAIITLVLLLSVSIRTNLIDILSYKEPDESSLVENMKRYSWNKVFLSNHHPLPLIMILKFSHIGGVDLYRITAYSYGVGIERAVRNDTTMREEFMSEFFSGLFCMLSGKQLPEEIPPATEFQYLNRRFDS